MDLYKDIEIPEPEYGDWSTNPADLPNLWGGRINADRHINGKRAYQLAVQAFYALCTHIDHQLRVVLGTLREEGPAAKHHRLLHVRPWRHAGPTRHLGETPVLSSQHARTAVFAGCWLR